MAQFLGILFIIASILFVYHILGNILGRGQDDDGGDEDPPPPNDNGDGNVPTNGGPTATIDDLIDESVHA